MTQDIYLLLYYKYKAYITSDSGWQTLYDEMYSKLVPSVIAASSIPSSVYKNDLTYIYGQMIGDTTTETLLATICPLSS
jgi:hypothetical protein